jgi:hypothetical protein
MPTFEFVCLANSLKNGGRCIAGFKTDGSGWFRPVSYSSDGTLYPEHYTLTNGEEPKLFDILRVNCKKASPKPHQPENWIISNKQWQKVGNPTRQELNRLLVSEINQASNSSLLLNSHGDRIEYQNIPKNYTQTSLCLIKPNRIMWRVETYETRKYKALFWIKNTSYTLAITDLHWKSILEKLPDGDYTSDQVINKLVLKNYDPNQFILTISLGEPFKPWQETIYYCFKLVAAVTNLKQVRSILNS